MDLYALLGQRSGSPALTEFIATLAGEKNSQVMQPEIKAFKDVIYHSYRGLGVSFHFVPGQEQVLDAIHLYRSPLDGFSTFSKAVVVRRRSESTMASTEAAAGTTNVVATLTMEMQGHQVLERLGEPEKKEGGGRRGNCWIGYQDRYGVSIDFAGSNWDDHDMTMSCLTLAR